MHLVIYGPEGSGKGTQAKLLSEKFRLPVYTSGDLVREKACHDKGEVGKACRKALKEGKYVPDKIMFLLWQKKLKEKQSKKGFILDGFPRDLAQAEFLLKQVEKNDYQIDKVIFLKINDEEAIKRLLLRRRPTYKGSSETHDTPERIRKRLAIYHAREKLLTAFFRKKNLLLEVDGSGSVEKVFREIIEKIK